MIVAVSYMGGRGCGSKPAWIGVGVSQTFLKPASGTTVSPNMEVFLENFRRGGVISGPKNYIADFFGFKTVYFGRKFWKKCPKRGGGGGSFPIRGFTGLRLSEFAQISEFFFSFR